MSKILAVKPVTNKAGRPMVIISTVEKDHWVTRAQWDGAKLLPAFDAYVGGSILTDYFKKGEQLLSGDVVDTDDIILRSFSVSMNPTVAAAVAGNLILQEDAAAKEAAAMFARKRAAETPEQAQARRDAARVAREARIAASQVADPANA